MPKQDDHQEIELRLNPGKAPLYQRLAEAIRDRVATGLLSPGNRLPPIRRLAIQLNIHTNTVARAYAELEREGVLDYPPWRRNNRIDQFRGSFAFRSAYREIAIHH